MRKVQLKQTQFGENDISKIEIDLRCRDEVPQLLLGLQYIYCTEEVRKQVFEVLDRMLPLNVNKSDGRPGMDLWKILVLGTIKLNSDWNYDKLHDIVNNHKALREMLGHGMLDEDYNYPLQTLRDNLALFNEDILKEINEIVVKAGHNLVKKKEKKTKAKCDSFVVKTDVHFPTDINLLLDAMRKIIFLVSTVDRLLGVTGWRQSKHNFKKIKKLYRKVQNTKRSTSKDPKKKEIREKLIKQSYVTYLEICEEFIKRAQEIFIQLPMQEIGAISCKLLLEKYIDHAKRQIDQVNRRVLKGEVIPHTEKVFSIFEEHTEWIVKGKAGVPQELGLRVCIVEDQYGFILNHEVMENETDDKVAVSIIEDTKEIFETLVSISFDKGFYSPSNKEALKKMLPNVVMPKKGKQSQKDKQEQDEEYFELKRKHSAVESAIHALGNHGLDKCRDHGIKGFKSHVALAVLARNIQIIGTKIKQKSIKKMHKKQNNKKYELPMVA